FSYRRAWRRVAVITAAVAAVVGSFWASVRPISGWTMTESRSVGGKEALGNFGLSSGEPRSRYITWSLLSVTEELFLRISDTVLTRILRVARSTCQATGVSSDPLTLLIAASAVVKGAQRLCFTRDDPIVRAGMRDQA